MTGQPEGVTACGDGTYCCGLGQVGVQCCVDGAGQYIVNNKFSKQKPTGLTSALSASTQYTTTETLGSHKTQTNVGAIVGGIIGGLILGALIAGLISFFLVRRRRNPQSSPKELVLQSQSSSGGVEQYRADAKVAPVAVPPGPTATSAPTASTARPLIAEAPVREPRPELGTAPNEAAGARWELYG